MSKKVIALYDKDKFIGYIKSAFKTKSGFDLTDNMWDCKTYSNAYNAGKAVSQYKERGFDYTFVIKDFEL